MFLQAFYSVWAGIQKCLLAMLKSPSQFVFVSRQYVE